MIFQFIVSVALAIVAQLIMKNWYSATAAEGYLAYLVVFGVSMIYFKLHSTKKG